MHALWRTWKWAQVLLVELTLCIATEVQQQMFCGSLKCLQRPLEGSACPLASEQVIPTYAMVYNRVNREVTGE